MIKVSNKVLCEHCFAETDREPCPECGFDSNTYVCDPMILRTGSILAGRYAIGRVIGKGGFGITYLAYDLKLECRVAVKEYYPYGLAVRFPGSTQVSVSGAEAEVTFKNGADKFYDEARLVAQFNGNPNIVSVYDFFYENDTVYFTMGYLDGQTLKDYLKEHGALTPGQAVFVADAVSNTLTAAHGRNVLHRDISPDNIMVCRDGSIKLLDFGAARQVLTEGSQSLSVILKQGFAPLEQYQKKGKQGPWTDIYSLGATLYHALTLDTLDDPMSRLEDDRAYEANNYIIEEGLWRIVKKATKLKGADRYQDVFELRKDLNGLSIKPVPLAETEPAGKLMHSEPVQGEEVGVTQPLREEDVGGSLPQKEVNTEKDKPQSHKAKKWMAWIGTVAAFVGILALIVVAGRQVREEGSIPVTNEGYEEGTENKTATGAGVDNRTETGIEEAPMLESFLDATEPEREENSTLDRDGDFQYKLAEDGEGVIITKYLGSDESVRIPNKLAGEPVVAIGESAFFNCAQLTGIELPEGLETIGDNAFRNCEKLAVIELPEGLETIGDNAFRNCRKLAVIDLPKSLVTIGTCAFFETILAEVHIPANVRKIGEGAFSEDDYWGRLEEFTVSSDNKFFESYGGALYERRRDFMDEPIPGELGYLVAVPVEMRGDLTIPDGVMGIYAYAFFDCKHLWQVTIPDSVRNIGEYAFYNCGTLTEIELPEGLETIEDNTFEHCDGLIKVDLPDSLKIIGNSAFYRCNALTEIELPEGLEIIGDDAFRECFMLTKVHLPESLVTIGARVFCDTSLAKVHIPANVAEIGGGAFSCDVSDITVSGDNRFFEVYGGGIIRAAAGFVR